jgi:hypothetical protein
MAKVLDRELEELVSAWPDDARAAPPRSASSAPVGLAQWLLAALLLAAGAVHFAIAPSHFGESTALGIGFARRRGFR